MYAIPVIRDGGIMLHALNSEPPDDSGIVMQILNPVKTVTPMQALDEIKAGAIMRIRVDVLAVMTFKPQEEIIRAMQTRQPQETVGVVITIVVIAIGLAEAIKIRVIMHRLKIA